MEFLVNKACAVCLGCCAALWAGVAGAHEGDTFRPFVSAGYFQDSNLFRLAEGESPGTQRDERYALYQAGLNVDWKPGRQQFLVNATKTLIRYDRNTFLDFDGDDLQANWNWRLGNRLSGQLGAAKSTSQSSFNDIGLVNNEVDRERRFARVEWEIHPRWRLGGGVDETDNTNSAPTQISQDVEQTARDVVLTYRTPKGSRLSAQIRHIEADYPTMQVLRGSFLFADLADNSFRQTEYNLLGEWQFTGKLKLRGQTGWVERQYDNRLKPAQVIFPTLVERPDFSGVAGRVSADWFPTGKTLVSGAVYQELGGATDINASSVLKRGVSLKGVWLVREKWRMNAGVSYENRDFRGDPGTVPGLVRRNDDTVNGNLGLSYMPIQAVSIDLGIQAGRRDSNIAVEDYAFRTVYLNVRGDF
jgi:exopolysaccharide biosynthesis operon protein EpsL